jgi:hypothetical protein
VDRWTLELDAWIVQDGNYGDFHRGQTIEVAVEFAAEGELVASDPGSVGASQLAENTYRIGGRVVHAWERGVVVDFGIRAFTTTLAQPPPTGAYVTGEVQLGVDPFDYFESLHKLPDFPPLLYTWRLEYIRRETTPWIERSPREFVRDEARRAFEDVAETNAWEDDGGHASYLLDCVRLDVPPKTTRCTAAS